MYIKFYRILNTVTCFLVMILILSTMQGCSSSNRRGKLSDAVGKAKDGEKDRKVKTSPRYNDPGDEDSEIDEEIVIDSVGNDNDNLHHRKYYKYTSDSKTVSDGRFGLAYGSGAMINRDFYGLNSFSFSLEGFSGIKTRLDLKAGFGYAPIQQTSKLNESLSDGVVQLFAGFQYNSFTTPQYTFMGQYFFGGFNLVLMIWNYRNPVLADVYDEYGNVLYTESITSDALVGFDLHGGLGWNVAQTKTVNLGIELDLGVTLWSWTTKEGFDNDVFESFKYAKLNFMVKIKP